MPEPVVPNPDGVCHLREGEPEWIPGGARRGDVQELGAGPPAEALVVRQAEQHPERINLDEHGARSGEHVGALAAVGGRLVEHGDAAVVHRLEQALRHGVGVDGGVEPLQRAVVQPQPGVRGQPLRRRRQVQLELGLPAAWRRRKGP